MSFALLPTAMYALYQCGMGVVVVGKVVDKNISSFDHVISLYKPNGRSKFCAQYILRGNLLQEGLSIDICKHKSTLELCDG